MTGRNMSTSTSRAFAFVAKASTFQVIYNTISPRSTTTSSMSTQEIAESWLLVKITVPSLLLPTEELDAISFHV